MTVSKTKTPPIEQVAKVPFELLKFDADNPRLMTGDVWKFGDDEGALNAYREIAALNELILSITANGYLNIEPLIIHGPDGGPYRVLEGNRRLAAMKAISDPSLARKCKISLPTEVDLKAIAASFKQVLVYRVSEPADADAFIGFKHINGPQRWDAYAKARFVAALYVKTKGAKSVEELARQTGDTNDTIRSYIGSILVLDQAEREGVFEIKNRSNTGKFAFSHLYEALDRPEFRSFLSLSIGWNTKPTKAPVKKASLPRLGELLLFIYGSKRDKIKAEVRSQNPDLTYLGRCLGDDRALEQLRAGAGLETALAVFDGGNIFGKTVTELDARAERALSLASKYDGNPVWMEAIIEIKLKLEMVHQMMKQSPHAKTPKKK